MRRVDALDRLAGDLDDELLVCYLGYPAREVYDRADRPENFYMLASMGQAWPIALGLALETDRPVVGLEGDGSLLMNLGGAATIASEAPPNLSLVLVDNGTYAATGDQPTTAQDVDLDDVVAATGLPTRRVDRLDEVGPARDWLLRNGCRVLVLDVEPGNADLPFVDLDPAEIKDRFVDAV